jgi:hypothetical protein
LKGLVVLTNGKAVISSAIYIRGQLVSDEEKRENKAKLDAWFDDYCRNYEELKNVEGN